MNNIFGFPALECGRSYVYVDVGRQCGGVLMIYRRACDGRLPRNRWLANVEQPMCQHVDLPFFILVVREAADVDRIGGVPPPDHSRSHPPWCHGNVAQKPRWFSGRRVLRRSLQRVIDRADGPHGSFGARARSLRH